MWVGRRASSVRLRPSTTSTSHPRLSGGNPELSVEDAFIASWCALNGILREGRLADEQLAALWERRLTPLAFLSSTLGGLLWEGDVRPEHDSFCHAYMRRLMKPQNASVLDDVTEIFGDSNNCANLVTP
ncbi:hypothetical protein CO670_29830 [Rhizobium sp. J15]|uniref:hypothetical protein n=1 Tax=Rhizobium sp. J15 TaxID=2035450 RepID=UPI000BE99884|nr:hypothetical protein [Rhizobium sp. J15]PDT11391.1 hypothetical protein CO670_29830 [Rhizobium sp. J15]